MELSIKQARCQIEFEGKHIMLKFPVTTRNTSTFINIVIFKSSTKKVNKERMNISYYVRRKLEISQNR